MNRSSALLAAALVFPSVSFAVGSDDDTPPAPTATTTECTDGTVWDAEAKECVAPKDSRLNDDALYRAVREFAYVGQYDDALSALAEMSDQMDDRVLTYLGFIHRKTGRSAEAVAFYEKALAVNPDNLLARSYYGQALAASGDRVAAVSQLRQIRTRDGRGTWPEIALRLAIESGTGTGY